MPKIDRPIVLLILDGWGYAPRTDANVIASAHTPYYDDICRRFPMTTLSATGRSSADAADPEIGHLNIGTGRIARTELDLIREAISSGTFGNNPAIGQALDKAREQGSAVHLVGLVSDAGIHAYTENLFAILRMAKQRGMGDVFVHCILDGLDVPERTADVYIEALEIKLADIGVGRIATLCGRFFAMDGSGHWERTARAFTLLAHSEGERATDPVTAIRNSFLRGISDEFISPIVIESSLDVPVATVKSGDLVIFFNHRGDRIKQLVRSLCIADGANAAKPVVDTVCLTEYDAGFGLPAAFTAEPEKLPLVQVLSSLDVPFSRITESARFRHMTRYFDGGAEFLDIADRTFLLDAQARAPELGPESMSFKIADRVLRGIEARPEQVFFVNMPAAGLMAQSGDTARTLAAVQYMDTCVGGIYEKVRDFNGVLMITSSYGQCEELPPPEMGDPAPRPTTNPVPFHLIDTDNDEVRLRDGNSLADVAPTLLGIIGADRPSEMTGTDLRSAR